MGRAIVWILKWKRNKMIVVSHDESYIVAVQRNTKCSGWVVDISECLLLAFAPFRSTKPGHPRPHLKAASIKGRKRKKFIIMICQSCSEEWKMFTVVNAWKEVGVPGRIEITKLHFCTSGIFAFSPVEGGGEWSIEIGSTSNWTFPFEWLCVLHWIVHTSTN